MAIVYLENDPLLKADEFAKLFCGVLWTADLDLIAVQSALEKTLNITARDDGALIGCVRIISDGYFMSAVCEVLVHSNYRNMGITKELFSLAYKLSPTSLMMGSQTYPDEFMTSLGWRARKTTYAKLKEVPPHR